MFSPLHEKALAVAKVYKKAEAELISILLAIDDCSGFRELGYPSLFSYVNQCLGLSEACAYQLILVGRKSREVPALQMAIAAGETTVAKAKTIVSVLTPQNQQDWLEKARTLSTRELEKAVAEERPESPSREIARAQGNGFTRASLSLDAETTQALERLRELLAQKKGKNVNLAEAIKEIALDYLKRHDPVKKADRNVHKTLHGKSKVKSAVKHQVHHRDRGACQFKLPGGKPCGSKQWVHLHHIRPRFAGGADTAENLITLCASHHRLVHHHGRLHFRSQPLS